MVDKAPHITATELQTLIGKRGEWQAGPIGFTVRIIDARLVFNRVDVKIEPIAGTGQKWVSLDSVAGPW